MPAEAAEKSRCLADQSPLVMTNLKDFDAGPSASLRAGSEGQHYPATDFPQLTIVVTHASWTSGRWACRRLICRCWTSAAQPGVPQEAERLPQAVADLRSL